MTKVQCIKGFTTNTMLSFSTGLLTISKQHAEKSMILILILIKVKRFTKF